MNPGELFLRLRFYTGNIYRFITSPIFCYNLPPNSISTIFASSYGEDGWNHIEQTLQEYDDNPQINYKDTTLYRYLRNFNPKSICDLIHAENENCQMALFQYPWGTFRKNIYTTNKDACNSRFCGPSSEDFIKQEFDRIINLYANIKEDGYSPWKYGNGFVSGAILTSTNGDKRFIVLQGNHRIAILSHLKCKRVKVRLIDGLASIIRLSNLNKWYCVKNKICSKEAAKSIFDLYFTEKGFHLLRLINQ